MKRITCSGKSQAANAKKIRREVERNIQLLNAFQLHGQQHSSSSSKSDENQGFSNHIPLTETEPTDGDLFYEFYDDALLFSFDVDEANASVAESDSDSTDNSVEIDVDDNALVVIEENPPQTFKDKLSSWGIDCGVPHVHLNMFRRCDCKEPRYFTHECL